MRQIIALALVALAIVVSPGFVFADMPDYTPGPGVSCTPTGETVTVEIGADMGGGSYTVKKCSFPGGNPKRVHELQAP